MGFVDYLRQLLGWWNNPPAVEVETVCFSFPPCYGSDIIYYRVKGSDTTSHNLRGSDTTFYRTQVPN